ncbi:MAG: hypothetical protein RJA61_710 [Candidatus Parcubacteria bacterium]|jgi:hypothetical protein
MKKISIALLVLVLLALGVLIYYKSTLVSKVDTFTACADAGYPVLESYPRQCRTPDGRSFVEDISNNKEDLIRVSDLKAGDFITSPLTISGQARGQWFFEASFPIRLLDNNGVEVAVGIAQAESDWMTTDFVPFKTTLTFTKPETELGTLVFQKDNPSGLPEFDDSLVIPVSFTKKVEVSSCRPTGCSSEICSDQDVASNCIFKEEYACYKKALCERQTSGVCGWTETSEFKACISSIKK